jgi:asparagine synthase (glutamine-hydrolysing)
MCGICGVFEYGRDGRVDHAMLASMLAVIRHRGPDDEGIHLDEGLGIGSRRLSIIDLPGGHQPISNEDGSVVVAFNGEIYNYQELHDRLRRGGHTLGSRSDTEVIVHLYEDHGDDLVSHLRGMFAFALWDARRGRLLLARDRLGIKPLYYADAEGLLVFGSEIKAILEHPGVVARLDLASLDAYLSLKYVPSPATMFEGIYALPPGHTLVCDRAGTRVNRYWDLSFCPAAEPTSEADAAERLEELLRESVRLHLMSDVPFGAFLSGGVDSSTIVALMSECLSEPVKTFSVGFSGKGEAYSELPYARMVAKRFGTDHHEVIVGPEDFIQLAERIVWHLDQPIADDACVANYMVAELASRHVKMVLTGEGGDELFAGYARYAGERFSPAFRPLPAAVKTAALAAVTRLPRMRRAGILVNAVGRKDEADRLAQWFPLFAEQPKRMLLSPRVRDLVGSNGPAHVFAEHLGRADGRDVLSRMLYVDTKLWLPDDLLARGDKTSMAASLEARVPLLDHRLVEFAAGLPSDLKLHRLARKYLLKKVSAKWLPEDIINRKKKGFPIPLSLWFRNEAREFVRDMLSPATVARRGLFDPGYVQSLLDDHDRGATDHGSLIWGLLSVELWHRAFLEGARPAAPASHAITSR